MLKREKEILSADDLTKLMTEKILGVDVNPSALRISCFSLYIALLDELTPKDILENQFHFPNLIGENLIQGSFFSQIVEKILAENLLTLLLEIHLGKVCQNQIMFFTVKEKYTHSRCPNRTGFY